MSLSCCLKLAAHSSGDLSHLFYAQWSLLHLMQCLLSFSALTPGAVRSSALLDTILGASALLCPFLPPRNPFPFLALSQSEPPTERLPRRYFLLLHNTENT